jgi:hypothetical protein
MILLVTNPDVVTPLMKLPADRRSASRFPIPQEVQYRLVDTRGAAVQGSGKVLDISSRGVRFTTDAMLPLGAGVQLSIAWPVSLSGGAALQLVVLGRVVRCGSNDAAVVIEKYEFRTRGRGTLRNGLGAAASGNPVVTPC